jgi:hypothetical protein
MYSLVSVKQRLLMLDNVNITLETQKSNSFNLLILIILNLD